MKITNKEEALKTIGSNYEICEKEYIRQVDEVHSGNLDEKNVLFNSAIEACRAALAAANNLDAQEIELDEETKDFFWTHTCQILTISIMEAHGFPLFVVRNNDLRDEFNFYPASFGDGGEEMFADLISIANENK